MVGVSGGGVGLAGVDGDGDVAVDGDDGVSGGAHADVAEVAVEDAAGLGAIDDTETAVGAEAREGEVARRRIDETNEAGALPTHIPHLHRIAKRRPTGHRVRRISLRDH